MRNFPGGRSSNFRIKRRRFLDYRQSGSSKIIRSIRTITPELIIRNERPARADGGFDNRNLLRVCFKAQ